MDERLHCLLPLIADEFCVRDTTAMRQDFGWSPRHRDEDMLQAAYVEYRNGGAGKADDSLAVVPAE